MVYDWKMKVEPYEWEYTLTEQVYEQWSSIMKTGRPLESWKLLEDNYETYFLYETETSMGSALQNKLMDSLMCARRTLPERKNVSTRRMLEYPSTNFI